MVTLSIITINLNNANGLQKTIDSVVCQTFASFEYIVIDGLSNDGSVDVIKSYEEKISYWVSEADGGIYDAMNKGIKHAKGKYLIFLNSGDVLVDKDTLSEAVKYMDDCPAVDIFYSDTFFKDQNAAIHLHKHPTNVNVDFLRINQLNHQSSLIRASLFDEYGLYPHHLKFAADHWLFLTSLVGNKVFMHIPVVLVVYEQGGLSLTHMDKYRVEADALWLQIVPAYARDMALRLDSDKRIKNFKLVKIALALSETIQRVLKRNK